jgi:hypothetical protein
MSDIEPPPRLDGCPSLSPETHTRCVLPDNADAHEAGHGALSGPVERPVIVFWDTFPAELERWAHGGESAAS